MRSRSRRMLLSMSACWTDRKSTRLNSSHTEIYTLSLHDALPIWLIGARLGDILFEQLGQPGHEVEVAQDVAFDVRMLDRSEEHTSELQSHRDLHSFPTRRSSDLVDRRAPRRHSFRAARPARP